MLSDEFSDPYPWHYVPCAECGVPQHPLRSQCLDCDKAVYATNPYRPDVDDLLNRAEKRAEARTEYTLTRTQRLGVLPELPPEIDFDLLIRQLEAL